MSCKEEYEFVYQNNEGGTCIDKKVLAEFRKLTANTVVYERSEKLWRKRESYDEPGKRRAD